MTSLLARAAAAFVEPAPAAVVPAAGALPRAARALVLGRPADALPLAAGLAGELRARERAAAALLVCWPCEPPHPVLAARPAQRLAARLDSRGLEAVARGRLAWLALSGPSGGAAAATVRAEAATDGPTVVAVTGPRCDALDALLDECDLVMVALRPDADPALAELALAGLAATRAPVIVWPPLSGASTRLLALAGRGRLRHAPSAPVAEALAGPR
jgi:hypothetical protein